MNTQHRPTRSPSRVLPHIRRRNGVIEAPRDPWTRTAYDLAASVGWRPQG